VPAGLISQVAPHSLARRVGLRPGDGLLAINGTPVRDVIDVQELAADEVLALTFERGGQVRLVTTQRRYGEPLGLEFDQPTFDPIRRCGNRCEFCFVAQMPPGLRHSLYVRDDDYRLSYRFGSYITLTNLSEADWERIAAQALTPLYVSVHATDDALRRRMLGSPQAPDILEQLEQLIDLGVEMHTQIVVVPDVNDGAVLTNSIRDLARLYPGVRSLSIVPVGLTRYHSGGCRVHRPEEMRAVLDLAAREQARLRRELGARFAYLSDEWYLRLNEPVPPASAYDGLDLTENGVGLVRRFLDAGFDVPDLVGRPATYVTGALFAPLLKAALAGQPGADVLAVQNRFFGDTVTVAGLLTGGDVIEQLSAPQPHRPALRQVVVLPAAMFGGPDGQSLDGMWPADVSEALGRPVLLAHVRGERPAAT